MNNPLLIAFISAGLWAGSPSRLPGASSGETGASKGPPAIDTSELSSEIRPQDDFWEYVNGRWLERTEIPADKARWGSFVILAEESRENVRKIIEDLSRSEDLSPGSSAQQIRDLYNSFMNEEHLNTLGASPLEKELAAIDALVTHEELADYLAHMSVHAISHPIGMWVDQDSKNTEQYITFITQSGLGLPDRDYYFEEGERFDTIRGAYRTFAAKIFELAGVEDSEALARACYDLEKKLAEPQWTRVENRDRDKTYNKLSREEFASQAGGFPWTRYWKGNGLADQEFFVVRQPDYVAAMAGIFRETKVDDWKPYLKLRVISDAAPYLSDDFFAAHFEFYSRTLSGAEQPEERWKRGVNLVNGVLGEVVGQEYVKRHFPPEAKARMLELVGNLTAAMRDSLEDLAWMTPATRDQAHQKLSKFTTKIGYPDKWKDYSKLKIVAGDLIGNLARASAFVHYREVDKLGGPIDRTEWFMTPQTVNAYYNPSMNEIVFPAAILQPPFFHLYGDDAVNYGGIGVVIGHEIGHGYDDQGRKSDGDGILRDWWTQEDAEEFHERTARLVEQFNRYEPVEGFQINGQLTLGENIGDLGGMTLAWRAYQKALEGKPEPGAIDGLTAAQRFFISYAQIWRSKAREPYLIQMLKTNPHAPPEYRVKGPLANFTPFYETFGVKEEDAMWLPPEQRVSIW